jgi:cyclic-di-AMP phosphodiesterase PgpH
VPEEDFRYPGPKPNTIEMGLLLLADSVEAASRSMEKPTPSRIENLVQDIVDSRLQDGQLDDCDLTFAQLKAIKRAFIFSLTNMQHGRVPYPKDEDRTKQSAEANAAEPKGPAAVRPLDHETRRETQP